MAEKNMKPKYQGYDQYNEEKRKAAKAKLASKREAAEKNAEGRTTNAYFASHDTEFMEACERAGVPNTPRQASKYQRKRGLAYQNRK
jgi:Tfp pilus assembly protein PilE